MFAVIGLKTSISDDSLTLPPWNFKIKAKMTVPHFNFIFYLIIEMTVGPLNSRVPRL